MPFEASAEWTFVNRGLAPAALEVQWLGERGQPAEPFGRLHIQRRETTGPTLAPQHVAVEASGRGRLVGLCALFEGRDDPEGGIQSHPLNLLEGDVRITIDGALALDGTGSEEYADDIFYFTDAPQGRAFTQAWGLVSDAALSPTGQANFCRWHVLGTELDFHDSIDVTFELGGAGNPLVVRRHHTVAFLYLPD
jgi:hypothetical protein